MSATASQRNCLHQEDADFHLGEFNKTLKKNGYNNNDILEALDTIDRKNGRQRHNNNNNNNDHLYLTIPYIDENTTQIIRRLLMKSEFNIRVSTTNKSLKDVINNKRRPNNNNTANHNKQCSWRSCKLKSDICHRKMITYKLMCYTCSKIYIGSSIRMFHVRFKEHHDSANGIIKRHSAYCIFPNFIAEIIDSVDGNAEMELRIKEAILIKELKPQLNTKEELNKLLERIL